MRELDGGVGSRLPARRIVLVLVVAVLLVVALTVVRIAVAGSRASGTVWSVVGTAFVVALACFVVGGVQLLRGRRDWDGWYSATPTGHVDPRVRREVLRAGLRGRAVPGHIDAAAAVALTGGQLRVAAAVGFFGVGGLAAQVGNVGNPVVEDPVMRWAPLLTQGLGLLVVVVAALVLTRAHRTHEAALERRRAAGAHQGEDDQL